MRRFTIDEIAPAPPVPVTHVWTARHVVGVVIAVKLGDLLLDSTIAGTKIFVEWIVVFIGDDALAAIP